MLPDIKTAAIGAVVSCLLAFSGGYKVASWRLTGQYNSERLKASQEAINALDAMTKSRDDLAIRLAQANDQNLKKLRDAQNATNALRNKSMLGTVGLRIPAACPRLDAKASADASAGMDIRAGAELDPIARQAYYALRDGIDQASAQLAACQAELRLRAQ